MSQRNSRSLLLAALILINGFFAPACFATLINNLTVQNSSQNGGTGDTYQICPGGSSCGTTTGFVGGATQYVDRTYEINPAPLSTVNGQMFIMTANSDKNADAGSSNYMSFKLGQAAIVYVVYCTVISPIPTWLTSNFLDTGTSITNNDAGTFELYSQTYAAGSTVVLGSNTVTGTNPSISMYSVVVVPIPTPLISNLIVNNTATNGGTGKPYQVCPGGNACGSTSGFQENALQYLDRTFQINSTVPAGVSGQTFIMTANTDKNADAGSSNYMSFILGQAATVYVVYCTAISPIPSWLTSGFTKTSLSVTNSSDFTFVLYSRSYAAGSTVTLGSNTTSSNEPSTGMYSVIVVPSSTSLISNLTVNNGGAFTYAICGTGTTCGGTNGFVNGALEYVDRSYVVSTVVPDALNGSVFIQTANGDKSTDSGGSDFISFKVNENAVVYVAHDVQAVPFPDWLTNNFMDIGQAVVSINENPGTTYEIYSNFYPSGTTIQLGGNLQSGTTPYSMYEVVVAPAAANTVAPTPPTSISLIPGCNTAEVAGFSWTASTSNSSGAAIAGYRIARNGVTIATIPFSQTSFQDTTASGSTEYTYAVSAFDQAGNVSAPASLNVTTAAPLANGEAAYCPSTVISSMSFQYSTMLSETHSNLADSPPYSDGSDLWPVTWGQDGNVYTFFGDGWGLCGELDSGAGITNDYTSFGVSKVTGGPPTGPLGQSCPSQFTNGNIYGGYNSSHPYNDNKNGLLNGKMSSIIAIGANFYGVGGVWRSTDQGGPNGSPNHYEVVSSPSNAYSWADTAWNFCSADSNGNPLSGGLGGGTGLCVTNFANFGEGIPSADGYVYAYGVANTSSYWNGYGSTTGANVTYLVRVPSSQITTESAYQFYSGLDLNGNPIWTTNINQIRPVFVDNTPSQTYSGTNYTFQMFMNIGKPVYDAPLKRYIAVAQGAKASQVAFYETPNPWGPWSVIYYTNINVANGGTGGWGNLGAGTWNGSTYVGMDTLGHNIVGAWTSADGKTLQIVFSSDGLAPTNSSFSALAGNYMDSFNLVEAILTTP